MSTRLAARAAHRALLVQRWPALLALLGVALGVAIVIAVDLANESARRALDLSFEGLLGQATHSISGPPAGLEEDHYVSLKRDLALNEIAPVVEGLARIRGETLRLLGIAAFSEGAVRPLTGDIQGDALTRLLTEPNSVLVSDRMATRLGLAVGEPLRAEIGGTTRDLRLVGLIEVDDARGAALDGLVFTDIATAQELLDRVGRLDRIDLVLDAGAEARLRAALPEGLDLRSTEQRMGTQRELTRAFHTNLLAMSLLALVVGGLLIYNMMSFSVLRRRPLLATLRTLGVTRAELFGLVLREALVIGVVGTALGLLLGLALAQGLLHLVTRTINDLYFVLSVTELMPRATDIAKGMALGLLTSLLAALGPAWEAAAVDPQTARRRSSLESRLRRALPWVSALGAGLLAAGWALAAAAQGLVAGFAGLFGVVAGYALMVPAATALAARALASPLGALLGGLGRLAARGIEAGLSRAGLAAAALSVALAATVGVGVMVESFRASVAEWLEQTLRADYYIASPARSSVRVYGELDADADARIRALPGVSDLSVGRNVVLDTAQGPLELFAVRLATQGYAGIRLIEGEARTLWPAFDAGEGLLVSEPLAQHRDLALGKRLRLPTASGPREFTILGVYADYSNTRGVVLMDRALYQRHWADRGISSLGVYLSPDADRQASEAALRGALAAFERPALLQPSAEIRRVSLEVFDRTFAITEVLRLLVIGVAFIGVISALLALELERSREHATLRALGLTPGQLLGLTTLQSATLGLIAGLLALPLGLLMAELLIEVINQRAFGWSMGRVLAPGVLAEALILGTVAAALAGLYPALRLARLRPAAALREA